MVIINNKIDQLFQLILSHHYLTGNTWCLVFNFRSYLYFKKNKIRVQIKYSHKTKLYCISNGKDKIVTYNRRLANRDYRNGIERRISFLQDVYFLHLIDFHDKDIIIDCGANCGDLYRALKVINPNLIYYGFEPSPKDFVSLCANVGGGGKLFNFALAHVSGLYKMALETEGANSSIIFPPKYDEIVTVQGIRLDQVKDFKNVSIKLLKIEVEGFEPEVLLGASNLLPYTEYITLDVGPERGLSQEETFEPVDKFLKSVNFSLIGKKSPRKTVLYRNNLL